MKKENKTMVAVQLMSAIISRASFMGMNPIAMGAFGAVYTKKNGRFFTFLVVCLGLVGVLPTVEFIKYVLIMVVVMIIVGLIESKGHTIAPFVYGSILCIVTVCMNVSNALFYTQMKDRLLLGVLEGVITFALVVVFHKGVDWLLEAKERIHIENEQIISVAMMLGLCVYAIPLEVKVAGSILPCSISIVCFLILFLGYRYGVGIGVVVGTVCGIAIGLVQQNVAIVGVFCLLGLLVGMFRELGRFFTAIAYGAGVLLLGTFMNQTMLSVKGTSGIEVVAFCTLLFLLLPKKVAYRIELNRTYGNRKLEVYAQDNMQAITKSKLKEFSEAFYRLSNTFQDIAQKKVELSKKDVTGIIEELSSEWCINCANRDMCWTNHYSDTYDELESILKVVEEKGYIGEEDMPQGFAKRCKNLNSLVAESSRLFEVTKLNIAWQNRLAQNREAIAGQLNEVASIIDEFSDDLYHYDNASSSVEAQMKYQLKNHHVLVRQAVLLEKKDKKKQVYMIAKAQKGHCVTTKEVASVLGEVIGRQLRPLEGIKKVVSKEYDTFAFIEDTTFKVVTGAARTTKVNEKISGDNFSFLNLERGEMIMSLSDGMGTGIEANEESESVIELFEQFMEAGFAEESAIRLINSILVLKSEEQSFSTIDLSVINLYSGVCEFIKIGAVPSFIKRDNWVETITSTTMPVGIFNQVDFDQKSKKLYDGDIVVMMSDGVLDCIGGTKKEEFIEKLLMKIKSNNPKEIANRILNEALAQNNDVPMDDMTVLVTALWKK